MFCRIARFTAPYMSLAKRMRTSMVKRIGTHDGTFHCDEALGIYLLHKTKKFAGAEVVRTRDAAVLDTLDAVIDVGGVCDPSRDRYDHHQREFTGTFGHGFGTKLSSAGLVYKHFGKEIVADKLKMKETDALVETIWLKVYKQFMEAIDGIDNGVNQYDGPARYVSNTGLSARVASLNPAWTEDSTPERQRRGFDAAVALTGAEFSASLDYYGTQWLPARDLVLAALASRTAVHPSGATIQLPGFCPWKEHLYEIEAEQGIEGKTLYCLYEDEKKQWRIQAVGVGPGSFDSRRPLPAAWRGLRDDALSAVAGVPGCTFCHASGFIGGNATLEGAKQMAAKALESE